MVLASASAGSLPRVSKQDIMCMKLFSLCCFSAVVGLAVLDLYTMQYSCNSNSDCWC